MVPRTHFEFCILCRPYIWEILHLTIRIKVKQVKKLQSDLEAAKSRKEDDDEEPIPIEDLERMEEKLDAAQSELKNLFLIIFQRFIMILTEHIAACESEGTDFKTQWFRWTVGRLLEVLFKVSHHANSLLERFESILEP